MGHDRRRTGAKLPTIIRHSATVGTSAACFSVARILRRYCDLLWSLFALWSQSEEMWSVFRCPPMLQTVLLRNTESSKVVDRKIHAKNLWKFKSPPRKKKEKKKGIKHTQKNTRTVQKPEERNALSSSCIAQ